MVTQSNKRMMAPTALAISLLSVSVVSMISINAPNNAIAQELSEGAETSQSGQAVPGSSVGNTGVASLDDSTSGQPGGGLESSPCTIVQTAGSSVQNATANTPTTNSTETGPATDNNNTMILEEEGEDTLLTSQIRDHIEQACIAIEVGDTEGALMQLDFAVGQLRGIGNDASGNNTALLSDGGNGTPDEGVSIGGTGPSDDYDATPDAAAG
jgi:hypothetical protein